MVPIKNILISVFIGIGMYKFLTGLFIINYLQQIINFRPPLFRLIQAWKTVLIGFYYSSIHFRKIVRVYLIISFNSFNMMFLYKFNTVDPVVLDAEAIKKITPMAAVKQMFLKKFPVHDCYITNCFCFGGSKLLQQHYLFNEKNNQLRKSRNE